MKLSQPSTVERIRVLAESIQPLDQADLAKAARHLDQLTKPLGSLGQLETIAAQLIAIRGEGVELPLRKAIYVFAADHGVARAGVSAYPSKVTAQMVMNFLQGGAAINVLARQHGAALTVVDTGVDADFDESPGLRAMKVRRGSRNFLEEPAMTDEEMNAALSAGLALADEAHTQGRDLVVAGEMGIGNTTAASAIAAMLTQCDPAEVTGAGTGLDDAGRIRKLDVIRRALRKHFPEGSHASALEVLQCVGGLEIAAMTGFVVGAAQHRMIVVCDGFISTAAAAIAAALAPNVKDYLVAGHCSQEPGHRLLLRHLGIDPVLRLNMRLGEGTGAVLAFPILESALRLYFEVATFGSAGISGASA
ncbi:MAG TPA: nicotinate-nucleotide--dimethylbenzimidazole phosphoribosyltransferase [Acidisarcina sp.]|nr:nicotinate-nucleotide--dimethylbenzimidazole phosphoribosyltransferase [Acidisarcina sp.]